jgi:hypothetical protein
MNGSFGIRFVLVTMMALSLAVTGCGDGGEAGGAGSGGMGGDGGMGGSAGNGGMGGMAGMAGSGGMGGMAGSGGMGGMAGSGGMGGMGGMAGSGGMGGMGGMAGSGGMGGMGVSFAASIQPYFAANCGGCHIDGSSRAGVNFDTRDNIVNNSAPLVVPFDSSQGDLIPQLNADHNDGPEDPPNGDAFVVILRQWIDEGALDN